MPDREKAISNLQIVHNYLKSFENTVKMGEWCSDALALLKEQEAVVHCKDCINRHDSINCQMYSEGMDTPDDWYCADGERKEGR